MMRAVLLPADTDDGQSRPQVIEIENTLDALQLAVGGNIQVVQLRHFLGGVGIINEDGKVHGDMPYNTCASMITQLFAGDYIVGRMLIVGDADGEFVSVTDELIDQVDTRTGWQR